MAVRAVRRLMTLEASISAVLLHDGRVILTPRDLFAGTHVVAAIAIVLIVAVLACRLRVLLGREPTLVRVFEVAGMRHGQFMAVGTELRLGATRAMTVLATVLGLGEGCRVTRGLA